MHLFYTPDITTEIYSLSEEESRHCQKVLRLREDDVIHLTDGTGTLFEARIADIRSRRVTAEVTGKQEEYGKRPYYLHLAVAPTKNIDRFEWFLEKATEIGVDEITPLLCDHSERKKVRHDRLYKVITSAVKQSLKAYHPALNEMVSFNKFLLEKHHGQLLIAHLVGHDPVRLYQSYQKGNDVTILIGPEGDFSPQEIESALNCGFNCVSLGESRLRTETAAVVACHSISFINSLPKTTL
jgi:16S rRNA (uracil1498-N3)-methyltransferase